MKNVVMHRRRDRNSRSRRSGFVMREERKCANIRRAGGFQQGVSTMCDYSLQHVRSRPAKVGDKLTTRDFGTRTRSEPACASTKVTCGEFVANLRRPRPDVLKAVVTHCGNSLLEAPSSAGQSPAPTLLAHYKPLRRLRLFRSRRRCMTTFFIAQWNPSDRPGLP